ncbi:MAG: MinD/ParA family protein [Firmicutes bacterium]|nr:MinD/ParA family protein [Bacillota bacterium]
MNPITVMIADDIANTREDIKRLLYFEDDMEVICEAGDGEEAVAMAKEMRPDIILMDINMPRLDGIGATEAISLELPETAIIIVSIQGEQEYLRKAMAAGAREFLVKPFSASELAETIRKVHDTHQKRSVYLQMPPKEKDASTPRRQQGRIITFFSTKGGTGKTTLATNLAVCLSQETKGKVVLVDLDLTAGDAAVLLNINVKGTVGDLVQEQDTIDFGLIDSFSVPHLSGTKLLPAPTSPEQAELIQPEHVEQILRVLKDNYDYIVIDTAPVYSEINLSVLESSDQVVLVLTQELPSLRQTTTALKILDTLNYAPRVRIVLNQHSSEAGIKTADLEKSINGNLSAIIPDDRKTVRSAINKGLPFVMSQTGSRVALSVREMVSTLGLASPEGMPQEEGLPRKTLISKFFSF